MERDQNNQRIFSQPELQKFFGNNLEKFLLALGLLIILTFLIYKNNLNIIGVILALFFLGVSILGFIKIQRRFAYKIVVDFGSRKLQLHMYKSDDIITEDFDAIQKIRVNGYIIFKFHDRTIYYNDLQDINLLECLNKIKRIEWGSLCTIWGPSKSNIGKITAAQNKLNHDIGQ